MLINNILSLRVFLKTLVFIVLFNVTFSSNLSAQDYKMVKPYTWMIGFHMNVIDDNGSRLSGIVDPINTWNYQLFPTAINIDLYFRKGLSAEFLGSYNYYDSTKVINGYTNREGHVMTLDLNAKYTFGYLLKQQWFDPFAFLGAGYTGREALRPQSMLSLNTGVGFNLMLFSRLGIQIRSTVKMGLVPDFLNIEGDYLQHHAGLIYKFPDKGRISNFRERKYSWTHKHIRYKKRSRGR